MDIAKRPWPTSLRTEHGLRQLGRRLRERHATTRATPGGYLDWDLAAPRTPLADLCQLTWAIAPISLRPFSEFGFRAEPDRLRRIEGLCEAYGVDPEIVLRAAPEHMKTAATELEQRSAVDAVTLRETIDWYLGWLKR